jgi:iron complex outermembrane recepter protein
LAFLEKSRHTMKKFIPISFLVVVLYGNTSLSAQNHDHRDEEIVELQQLNITASPFALTQQDVVNPSHSVSAAELRRSRQSSLGATLDGQPGIHSTSYAPGAGRPVIRGFDGDRISILQNGTDTFDVSFTSPDHGVAVESLFIDKVEVVRGPASLLYGNAAIGGVVNVIDKSLPRETIVGVTGEAEFQYGSVSEETAGGISVQGGQSGFAWSLNYFKRDADDYDIPGFAESAFLRESEEQEGEEHEEEVLGTLENSFAEAETFAVGAGWFGESVSYSLSYSQFESFYGVPGHSHAHGHEEEHGEEGEHDGEEDGHEEEREEESVAIDLRNRRTALRVEWTDLGGLLESAELDAGYGDYQHTELEGEADAREVGTIFKRDGFDLRLSGIHRPIGDWSGALGVDVKSESFEAIGEEAFIPGNDKRNHALFAVERLETIWGALEFGGRIERQSLDPEEPNFDKNSKTTYNLSTGLLKRMEDRSVFAANLSYNERAPNAAELFAFGPHAGTGSFEIGNPDLDKEQSLSADLSWRKSVGNLTGELTVFYSDFQDYIFLEHLDHETFESLYPDADHGELDILQAEAVEAEFYGFELDLRFHIVDTPDRRFHFDLTIDQTRATNGTEHTNLPRIPTRRIGGRLGYESGPWNLGFGMRYHSKASHLAPEETPTESYTLVYADINYHLDIGEYALEFFAIGRNLGDEEARPHTSFVKDLVPMPGRTLELGTRVLF